MAVLLYGSSAVTVKVKALPAVALGGGNHEVRGRRRGHVYRAAGPAIEPLTVSVAVSVWLPAVFSVALNVPPPLVNVALAGRIAAASLLLKWTVPA